MARSGCTAQALSLSALLLWTLLPACRSPQPAEPRAAPVRVQSSRPTSQPAPASSRAPGLASQPAASLDAPRAAEPELPEYVTIVRLWNLEEPTQARVQTEGDERLIIETENVRRIRIARELLPLSRHRSIALLLDGQPFEWTVGSKVSEFEQNGSGVWHAVQPR